MRIDIATLFPAMCDAVLGESIVGRGIKNGFIEIHTHDIRPYTENKHNRVDDKPYGGGTGMVMQAQPIYDCICAILKQHETRPRIIYMSPQGKTLTQAKVKELAAEKGLVILCGHYEGVDQRVLDELQAEEISVGDYVLTGGELPALILADAIARLQPGVLPNEDAYSIESHEDGLLEYPQYTRPEVWHDRAVPEVLLNGDHKAIADWQYSASLGVTESKRPDMMEKYVKSRIEDFINWYYIDKDIYEEVQINRAKRFSGLSAQDIKAILRGKRRALIVPYDDKEFFLIGELFLVTDEDGLPHCIVQTKEYKRLKLREITPWMALRAVSKPEGDGEAEVIYEEFKVIYK
ncbi:MAG: tRNA (guanosine(37)-N1)-methyltransferase TrmD [Oscillospiraceae bacterium]